MNKLKVFTGLSMHELIAQKQEEMKAEEARYNAMTPEEQQKYRDEQQKEEKKIQEILKKLPGLTRITL